MMHDTYNVKTRVHDRITNYALENHMPSTVAQALRIASITGCMERIMKSTPHRWIISVGRHLQGQDVTNQS